ncbi:hypothetical protein S40288_01168 [Stachybotrys chartarum IBT 40288]|nr:hypothetical protein S40288_01168 [Stachybotrys chartarum IBT 40288]
MAIRGWISYWWLPVISGLVWLGMLLGMLLHWIINENSRRYPGMTDGQTIAYISDIGADELQPLFIAGSVVTTVFLDLSFAAERWLRHNGRLAPNGTTMEKVLAILSIIFALIGTAGLILLSIFDTNNYNRLHNIFLLCFIAGYLLSAVFICWEYGRLGLNNRHFRVLRISFWMKLTFVLVELCLAIAFAATTFSDLTNVGAILEWVVSLIFTLYAISFYVDLAPAVKTKSRTRRFVKPSEYAMEEGAASNPLYNNGNSNYHNGGPHYYNGDSNRSHPTNF